MHISLAAEKIFSIGPLPVSNSMLNTFVVIILLVLLTFFVGPNVKTVPGRLQSLVELVIEAILNLVDSIAESKSRIIFPFVVTFFIFILCSNWLGLLPGVGTIGIKEKVNPAEVTTEGKNLEEITDQSNHSSEDVTVEKESGSQKEVEAEKFVPLFRAATADLNTTLALAIIGMVSVQIFGLKNLGVGYSKKFFNFSSPIMFFVGFLELISEFSKIISFGFRLYGNIFAGEVLMGVIAFLVPIIAPTPFYFLEVFVGFIQALVFTLLLTVFLTGAAESHSEAQAHSH